jgi:hypothetical protein
VVGELAGLRLTPLVEGTDLPYFWARQGERELVVFFAHPLARNVRYPMAYGQSYCDGPVDRTVTINYGSAARQVALRFEPYQSIMLRIGQDGEIGVLDVAYYPVPPVRDPEP